MSYATFGLSLLTSLSRSFAFARIHLSDCHHHQHQLTLSSDSICQFSSPSGSTCSTVSAHIYSLTLSRSLSLTASFAAASHHIPSFTTTAPLGSPEESTAAHRFLEVPTTTLTEEHRYQKGDWRKESEGRRRRRRENKSECPSTDWLSIPVSISSHSVIHSHSESVCLTVHRFKAQAV